MKINFVLIIINMIGDKMKEAKKVFLGLLFGTVAFMLVLAACAPKDGEAQPASGGEGTTTGGCIDVTLIGADDADYAYFILDGEIQRIRFDTGSLQLNLIADKGNMLISYAAIHKLPTMYCPDSEYMLKITLEDGSVMNILKY